MLKQHDPLVRLIIAIADLIIIIFSFLFAIFIRSRFFETPLIESSIYFSPYYWGLPLVIWIGIFASNGLYKTYRFKSFKIEIWNIFRSVTLGILILLFFIFFFKFYFVSRAIVILFWFFSLIFLSLYRLCLRALIKYYRRRGYNFRMILIAGTGRRAKNFVRSIEERKDMGLKIIGFVGYSDKNVGKMIMGYPVLGTFNDVYKIISQTVVDMFVLAPSLKYLEDMSDLLKICEIEGIDTYVLADYLGLSFAEMKLESVCGLPMLLFHTTPQDSWKLLLKRIMDIFISSLALMLLSPLFLLIMIIIKLDSKGSIFFSQIRSGLNGRKFRMYKFRTMITDAEKKLEKLKEYNEMDGPVFKMKKDPRITRAGCILRRFSLDELPQLYNVWRGEMSIVGPRPPLPVEVEKYERWQRRRLSMKPGITCLWQVNGRNNIDFHRWMELDMEYIDNWSLMLDLKIIAKTFPVVLFGTGAQ